jgi:hypothetical protein
MYGPAVSGTMAGATPPPRERAALGLAWAIRGLIGFLVLQVATAAGLVLLVPMYGLPTPSIIQVVELEGALLVLSWLLLILGVASGLVYCVGLAGLYAGRRGLDPEHARSVEQTLPWLAVTILLLGTGIVVPAITGPFMTFPSVGYAPPSWSESVSVVLAGLRAIFAGLTLFYAVQGLAEEDERVRLLVAMSLGVAGAVLWSGLAAYASGVPGPSMDSLLPFLVGILAGLGTSAISVGLFIAVYREIRRGMQTPAAHPA